MERSEFRITDKTVWWLTFGSVLLTLIGALAKIEHLEFAKFPLYIGIAIMFTAWTIIFSEIVRSRIALKYVWMIFMFVFPALAMMLYLVLRNRAFRKGVKLV
ncbi:hypothetical protein PEDI_54900 [Persicobacter diffluens]|uniref:Uncharacterized protein n=1 Tax=Persicobacter diffluens TaxID=981 RepID=A0AAN4W5E2_9BACT|nr:hypothetical protein PEDI_54900 [Persicobacter diffluens]